MNKKIILVGKSQSGKTYFAEELEKLGLHKAVTTTTRPMRGYEINGTHYNFISKTLESFKKIFNFKVKDLSSLKNKILTN